MINTTIGKYKIIRLIGEGGMANVYEAEHELLGTKVAIKVLNPILSANAQIKERFRNEAKLMASLNHPNITRVLDFDEQPQQLSIVMDFLDGEDLNQKIKTNGPLSDKEIEGVFSQTLSAFQYAHDKGIVHRDIKPSNIFILPDGQVKILDFGIAKLFGQGNEMTQTGTQMGTPIYMSPEQVKADKTIDHRSDIYSLGVTMFFAINGKPPYNSDTDSQFDIFTKIVYEALPEFSKQSRYNEIVLNACQKNKDERFQNCNEFIRKLGSSNTSKTEVNDKKTIETATAEPTVIDSNKTKDYPQERILEGNNSSSQPFKKASAHSLLLHFLPGIVLFSLVSYDYQRRGCHVLGLLRDEYCLLLSILALILGFIFFRNQFGYKNVSFYKSQIRKNLFLAPGLLSLIATNYQFGLRAIQRGWYDQSIFPWIYYLGESRLFRCSLYSTILFVLGLSFYIITVNKERHS
jgi:serine/threonine protein kinase